MAQAEDGKPEIGNPEIHSPQIDPETQPESVVSHSLEPRILDGAFRNGTMTAIGVLLGFSLGFLNSWANNPLPWDRYDLWGAAPLVAGILLQILALYLMLQPESLQLANYRRAIKFFVAGLLLACAGVFLALVDDAYVAAMSHRGVAAESVN